MLDLTCAQVVPFSKSVVAAEKLMLNQAMRCVDSELIADVQPTELSPESDTCS